MKARLIVLFVFVVALVGAWVNYPLWAQQGGFPPSGLPQSPDGRYPYPSPYGYPNPTASQTPTPYLGAPMYNPNLLPDPRYFQGAGMFPQTPPGYPSYPYPNLNQQSQAFPLQGGQRTCGATSPVPMTRPPSPSGVQSPSPTIPVQGPWPGGDGAAMQGLQSIAGGQSMGQSTMSTAVALARKQREAGQDQTKGREPASGATNNNGAPPWAMVEPLSAIEAAFNQPVFSDQPIQELRQFGYSLFANPISTFAPMEDVPVGPDYILGPGDDMLIRIWGSTESSSPLSVDRNGQVSLPYAGPVRVWGLTFKDASELINQQLSRYYRGIQTSVTMGRLRAIKVYVVGEVCQPGSFTLSSLSTVTNALFAAGGPIKLGSLRNIQLKRNHHTVGTVDLYDFLLRGDKTQDFRLESGDTIFLPPIGSIAAITGEVKRPSVYELRGTVRVSDLIEMAGGTTPRSYLKRVQVMRTKPNAEREVIDLDLTDHGGNGDSVKDIEIQNGDLVKVYPTDPRIYNTVRLSGAVKQSGEYELKAGMRVSDLVTRSVALPEAYVDQIEVARLQDDLTTRVVEVNLKQVWAGDQSQDINLRSRDQITVRSEYRSPWKVTLGGEVKRPGIYTVGQGERLSSVLRRAGGFTDKAFPKGAVLTRASVRDAEKRNVDAFVTDQQQKLMVEAGQLTMTPVGINKDDAAARQSVLTQRLDLLEVLASKVTLGRVVLHLDEPEKLEGSPSDLVMQDGDTLTVPHKPAEVLVMGSVRNPTGVLHQENMDVQYYLNRAGGLKPEADTKGIYVLKADGSAITGFMRLRNIEPGDVIMAPPSTEAPVQWMTVMKDLASIVGQAGSVALGAAGLRTIFK